MFVSSSALHGAYGSLETTIDLGYNRSNMIATGIAAARQREGTIMAIRLGIVGLGKIAGDQHVPHVSASREFELVATASRNARLPGIPAYASIHDMLESQALDAVALCQPPQFRFDAARLAIQAGKHVLLEKPPAATLSEAEILRNLASTREVTLFASWHSRFAAGVRRAREWLGNRTIRHVSIRWKEDVRHWHPGQEWIWQAGGMGVFDPGINALSIVTEILPQPMYLTDALLHYPRNREAPIAADLTFATPTGVGVVAEFDWRQIGEQSWDITVQTDAGTLILSQGGASLTITNALQDLTMAAEYQGLYRHFATLVHEGRSDVDLSPLRHVADAFLRGRSMLVEAFED